MFKEFIDLTGKKFGFLEVLRRGENYDSCGRGTRWVCRCVCGKECIVGSHHLRSTRRFTKSCGCLKMTARRTHGHKSGRKTSPEYNSWRAMRLRCINSKSVNYKD